MNDPNSIKPQLTIGQCATLACLFEVTAPKHGNVHRAADFPDLHFADFLASATAIGPVFEQATEKSVGLTIRDAIRATQAMVRTNTNLGIVLLLSPLASVPRPVPLNVGIPAILGNLTSDDAGLVYAAIRCVQPGGMGEVSEYDIRDAPPNSLLAAMEAARDRDMIAKQYVTDFVDVFAAVECLLTPVLALGGSLFDAIVWTHLGFLARCGDSLIARKRGVNENEKAQIMALRAIEAGPEPLQASFATFCADHREADGSSPRETGESLEWSSSYWHDSAELDFWMRSQQGRNPGTTADLVTAALFCALREGVLTPPFRWSPPLG